MEPPSRPRGTFIAKVGAWLQLAQVIGILISLLAMMLVFNLDKPETINHAWMLFIPIGFSLSLIGAILIVAAITVFRFRSSWMYHLLSFYGPLLICVYFIPVVSSFSKPGYPFMFCLCQAGIGLFFFVFALAKKNEFLRIAPLVE
jgi:hypothetical protein